MLTQPAVRRIAVLTLIAGHIAVPLDAGRQQRNESVTPVGVISGDAKSEAKKPYENYTVWIVDLDGGSVARKVALELEAAFRLSDLNVPGNYMLQLVDIKKSEIVCTEGPFRLTAATPAMKDAKIDCGSKVPAGYWLLGLAAAAGVTAAVLNGPAVSAVR